MQTRKATHLDYLAESISIQEVTLKQPNLCMVNRSWRIQIPHMAELLFLTYFNLSSDFILISAGGCPFKLNSVELEDNNSIDELFSPLVSAVVIFKGCAHNTTDITKPQG